MLEPPHKYLVVGGVKAAEKLAATSKMTQPDTAASNKSLAIFNRAVSVECNRGYADWIDWNWIWLNLNLIELIELMLIGMLIMQLEGETWGIALARNNLSKTLLYSINVRNWYVAVRIGSVKTGFLDDWGSPYQSWIVSKMSPRRKISSLPEL